MTPSPRFQRRGFVLIAALLLLMIVGAALAVLTALVSADGQRTISRNVEAQLEQMLLAGAADAPEHLASMASPTVGQSWNTELPSGLASQKGSLRSTITSVEQDRQIAVVVRAGYSSRSAEQTLQFAPAPSCWKLTTARLVGN